MKLLRKYAGNTASHVKDDHPLDIHLNKKRDCWEVVKHGKAKSSTAPSSVWDNGVETNNRFQVLDTLVPDSSLTIPSTIPFVQLSTTNYVNRKSPHKINVYNNNGTPNHQKNHLPKEPVSVLSQNKPVLTLCADSHGRYVSRLLRKKLDGSCKVTEWVKPNGRMEHVLETVESYSKSECDCIIIIGGTNNIVNGRCGMDFISDLNVKLNNIVGKRVILVGLPPRHDEPALNPVVSQVNARLHKIASEFQNVEFLSLDSFPRSAFTVHGLHLNQRGKKLLASLLLRSLCLLPPPIPRTSINSPCRDSAGVAVSSVSSRRKINNNPDSLKKNSTQTRTFFSSNFLGEALKPPGVPWMKYLGSIVGIGATIV